MGRRGIRGRGFVVSIGTVVHIVFLRALVGAAYRVLRLNDGQQTGDKAWMEGGGADDGRVVDQRGSAVDVKVSARQMRDELLFASGYAEDMRGKTTLRDVRRTDAKAHLVPRSVGERILHGDEASDLLAHVGQGESGRGEVVIWVMRLTRLSAARRQEDERQAVGGVRTRRVEIPVGDVHIDLTEMEHDLSVQLAPHGTSLRELHVEDQAVSL